MRLIPIVLLIVIFLSPITLLSQEPATRSAVAAMNLDSVLGSKINEIKKKTIEVAKFESEVSTLRARVTERETEISNLKKSELKYKTQRNGYRDTLERKKAELNTLNAELKKQSGVIADIESQLINSETSSKILKSRLSENLKLNAARDSVLRQATATAAQRKEANDKLKASLVAGEKALENEKLSAKKNAEERAKLANSLLENSALMDQKENELSAVEARITLVTDSLEHLNDDLEKEKKMTQKLKEDKEAFNKTLNVSLAAVACILLLAILIGIYFLFAKKEITNEELDKYGDPNNVLLKDVVEQLFFVKRAIGLSKAALGIEFIGIVILSGVLMWFHFHGNNELAVLALVKDSIEKFVASFGIPVVFFVTLYNVLDARRIELIGLLHSFK